MAVGLIVPISGPYVGTFNALPMGTQADDGYELSATLQGQEINASDAYGLSLVEGIFRGSNWRLRFRGLEWNKTGLSAIIQEFGQTGLAGTFTPNLANIGNRWTLFNQVLLLTAILGNPPTTPQTLTANNAGFAPNFRSEMLMTSKMREMPLEMVLIPYTTGGGIVPFTTT